ncbi:hypothetical protein [Halomicrobium sp. LC1Hm]|nr:hypothetical protein [Halomicrobium sp. LC1Hm]
MNECTKCGEEVPITFAGYCNECYEETPDSEIYPSAAEWVDLSDD